MLFDSVDRVCGRRISKLPFQDRFLGIEDEKMWRIGIVLGGQTEKGLESRIFFLEKRVLNGQIPNGVCTVGLEG